MSFKNYDYIVSNSEELIDALNNIGDGETLFIKNGTYSFTGSVSVANCKIIGESKENTILHIETIAFNKSYNSQVEVSNITFDAQNNRWNESGFIYLRTADYDSHIHDCNFLNRTGTYNCPSIRIVSSSAEHSTEINDCLFEGANTTTGYGHTKASIAAFQISTVYNLKIHHNTFNHPTGGSNTVRNGKAISCINNYSLSSLVNCKAYCNKYLGSGDYNDGISESDCPES